MLLVCAETSRSFIILNNTHDSVTLSNIPRKIFLSKKAPQNPRKQKLKATFWLFLKKNSITGSGDHDLDIK